MSFTQKTHTVSCTPLVIEISTKGDGLASFGHCQLHAKNLHRSAVPRKLSLMFFFHDRLSCHHLSPVSFPHEEGARARFFMKLPMPSVRCPLRVALRRPGRGGGRGRGPRRDPRRGPQGPKPHRPRVA